MQALSIASARPVLRSCGRPSPSQQPFRAAQISRMSSAAAGSARRRSIGAAASPASHPVVAAAANQDVQGEMLDAPSAANKNIVRLLAIAAVVAGAARGTAYLPATGIAFVHMLAYGTWLGSLVWTSFVAGIVMFKNLPRQTFGRIQAKLFPCYFGLSAACCAIQLGVLLFAATAAPQKQLILLGTGLVSSLLNLLIVEPACTRVMFERYALENAEGARDEDKIKALRGKFGKMHGLSSVLNLVTLIVAVGHGFWLAQLAALPLLGVAL